MSSDLAGLQGFMGSDLSVEGEVSLDGKITIGLSGEPLPPTYQVSTKGFYRHSKRKLGRGRSVLLIIPLGAFDPGSDRGDE